MKTRIEEEKKVIRQMITIYCNHLHKTSRNSLCDKCSDILSYAETRLEKCPKGNAKTSCRKCPIHCYSPTKRELMRRIMRYVGPKMIYYHPVAAVKHLIRELN